MIERAIYDHLSSDETLPNAQRQTAKLTFRHNAGRSVFLGRVPTDNPAPIAVSIRRITGGETYNTVGEEGTAQPVVEVLLMGRDPQHATQVLAAAEALRIVFSGYVGPLGDHYCQGCQVVRSQSLAPLLLPDGADRWNHAYICDLQFTVDQVVVVN